MSLHFCRIHALRAIIALAFCSVTSSALSHSGMLQEVEVVGRRDNTQGLTLNAGEGTIGSATLSNVVLERNGDLLELVPGMVATQHSGSGKANQYFLRGFNLDHGTDFATRVDFMPLNMVSHGHGQGYTDLSFVIPELIHSISYRKGPYYGDVGDFAGVGEAHLHSAAFLPEDKASLTLGDYGYRRLFAVTQVPTGLGQWLVAAEGQTYDGPWKNTQEDVQKKNVWLKYASGNAQQGIDVALMAYHNRWNSADQIPLRAVDDGRLSPFSTVDPSSGGESERFSLSLQKRSHTDTTSSLASAYLIRYGMDLWSNFTYFTRSGGDQIMQQDRRWIAGSDLSHSFRQDFAGKAASHTIGWQFRYDHIDPVSLGTSIKRIPRELTRSDKIDQYASGLYWQSAFNWQSDWTSVLNIRWNFHGFDVDPIAAGATESLSDNGGIRHASIWTGSLRNQYTPTETFTLFWHIGRGYHSNDARGVLARRDPVSGDPIPSAEALVPVDSTEMGGNWRSADGMWSSSFAVWATHVESELLFVGDEGVTEDVGASSDRYGIEYVLAMLPSESWLLQADYAYTHAQLNQDNGDEAIPGALRSVVQLQARWDVNEQWSVAAQWRHIGRYPLGDGVMADSRRKADLNLRFQPADTWAFTASALNLFNDEGYDVEYWYESQLAGEVAPVVDRHVHSVAPRALRLQVEYAF